MSRQSRDASREYRDASLESLETRLESLGHPVTVFHYEIPWTSDYNIFWAPGGYMGPQLVGFGESDNIC